MNRLKKSIITGAVAWASLILGGSVAPAQEKAEEPFRAEEQPAAPTAMTTPAMTGPLAANPNPMSFDAGPVGPVFVTGAVSGLGLWQNNKFPDQQHSLASLSNGHVFLQKTEGIFQYFINVGAYTFPALGAPYFSTATTTGDFFGPVPVAYAKVAPTDDFYIEGGKLPTLIGAEYAFTFQNMNIERGLLWAQEPIVSRGGQLGYTIGPMAVAGSWNDGFYSNRYTWLSGSATYTLDPANSFVIAAGGNFSQTAKVTTTTPFFQTTAVPLFQNNERIFNLIYTYNSAPWTITPYFQHTYVPTQPSIGALTAASTFGGAILANYSFGDDTLLSGVSLPVRFEYIGTTGKAANGAPNLLFGPGSNAWSITFTPTYQYKIFFARAEISHVGTTSTTPGLVFGPSGTNRTQTRGLLEVGVLF
ncbi:MAG TPA: outer membrane beta-barrel protein [Stellaceae bacterium]|nr:outer membrane beta-barrel protein [Stellaceae bacterium]